MSASGYVSKGETLEWTNNTGAAVSLDAVVVIGGSLLLGILRSAGMGTSGPNTTLAAGSAGTVAVEGRFNLDATSADVWRQGDRLYWNASTSKLTNNPENNYFAGLAAKAKASGTTTADVLLNEHTGAGADEPELRGSYKLVEPWKQPPGVIGDSVLSGADAAALVTQHVIVARTNRDFMVSGTNSATGTIAMGANGGVTLTTAGASADQMLLGPHTATSRTLWGKAGMWNTNARPRSSHKVVLGASVATQMVFAGLKKTNTPVAATDDDQAYFLLDTAGTGYGGGNTATHWQLVTSRAGVDTITDTGVVAEASTAYDLEIQINDDRTVVGRINGEVVSGDDPLAALTANVDLYPFAGQHALSAAAKSATWYQIEGEREAV